MDAPRQDDPAPPGPGGWSASLAFLALAVGMVGGAVAWWWSGPAEPQPPRAQAVPVPAQPPQPEAAAPPQPAGVPRFVSAPAAASPALPPAATVPPAPVARNRDPDGDQTPDLSDYVNPGEQPTMGEVIRRLQQAGVHTGLAAFPPPGTRPPLVGLAVPEDFVLPEGYVRHHQATDDGQRIEAILMFSPDRQFVDAAGRPVAIPADRVVPPELAPPGLPIRRITLPPPAEPARPGR